MKLHPRLFIPLIVSALAATFSGGPLRAEDKKDDDHKKDKDKKHHKEEPKHEDSRTKHVEPKVSHSSSVKEHEHHEAAVKTENRSNRVAVEPKHLTHVDPKPSVHHEGGSVVRHDEHKGATHGRYVEHHEHHSSDWYASNGWREDSDYWRLYHRHRYFHDGQGIVIIEPLVIERGYGSGRYTEIAVQRALADAGYYRGEIDGDIGPGSRNAIAGYQADNGLRPTGLINDPLLESLGIR